MPGSRPRDEPWRSWGVKEWTCYRDAIAAHIEAVGEPWSTNIGYRCLAMADFHLARSTMLDADALAR